MNMLSTPVCGVEIKKDEVENYLNPSIKNFLPNPENLQDMKKTSIRMIEAIEKNEKCITQVVSDLENINAHLYSIEALMERIFDVKVPDKVEDKFREMAGELAPDPLNTDRLRLNRLLHQTPDLPDK